MPPSAVKTIEDVIFWQYAKIISKSAGKGKRNYRFIMHKFKQLQEGEINWSSSVREYLKERQKENKCIYCDKEENLTVEHLLPTSRGGPDIPENTVLVCKSCNSAKGDRRLFEWFGLKADPETVKYDLPRIAEGKYLKLLYTLLAKKGKLNVKREELEREFCDDCRLAISCPGGLSVFCLEGIFTK